VRIAFISRWFVEENKRTEGRGGSEQQRVRGYVEAGHEVVVLSQEEESSVLEKRQINGISVVTTPRWRRVWWLVALDKLAKGWSHHRKVFSDAWQLRLFLKKFGPFDVLEAQCEEPDGLVVALCSLFHKVPPWCIQLFALRYSFRGSEPRFEQKASLGFAFGRADLVKANSALVAEFLEKEYGCPKEKIVVVHPNVELPGLPPAGLSKTRPYVLCIGAVVRTKGIETFVRAAELLAPKEAVDLVVAGGVGEDAAYAKSVMSTGKSVKWLGELKKEELYECVAQADVVVIPSWFDAWNRAAIEAVALGKPVVISDRCGAAEWIQKQGVGVAVRAGEPEQLAAGIRQVLGDRMYAEAARGASGEARRAFGVKEITRQNLAVFDHLRKIRARHS
jgi:glycosyltransferase involved in cell wall biosynthesis